MPFAEIDTTVDPPMIRVATTWNEKELIQQIPGSSYRSVWRVPLTWAACVQLRGVFQERLLLGENIVEWASNERKRYVDTAVACRELLEPAIIQGPDRLFPFQRAAVDFMLIDHHGVLGDEMGAGKTIETIGYLQALSDEAFPVLIVCPNSVKSHWAQRVQEWIPDTDVFIYESSTAKKDDVLTRAKKSNRAVVIVNYESTRILSKLESFGATRLRRCQECDRHSGADIKPSQCQVHPKPLNQVPFKTIILDEAHRIKDPKSQQTRACWAICHMPSVKHVWGLTGTPIANHVGDLWSVMHAISPAEYPTKSKFVDRYALTSWNAYGGLDIVGINPSTADEFRAFFSPRFRRVTKDMVLPQLPPKVHTIREVDMSVAQRRMYNELENTLMCRTANGDLLITKGQLAASTRLSQLSCASVKITDKPDPNDPSTWTVELREPSSKIDELVSIVEELGSRQAVVAAEHSKLIDLACARLEKERVPHLKITGDVSPHDRQRALEALNKGHIKLLLFTTKAGGIGLDMSAAACLIWLQHPWSMIEYLQTEDRVRRIGSERHSAIDIIHIITRGTVEQDKIRRLQDKLHRLDELTQDRKRLQEMGLSTLDLDNEEQGIIGAFLGVS